MGVDVRKLFVPVDVIIRKSLLSFERASTPGQTQTGLGPRVYSFTTPGCCTVRIRCWQ